MKIKKIETSIISSGKNSGTPCVYVDCVGKKEMSIDDVIKKLSLEEFILHKTFLIRGVLLENPEIKTIVLWLISRGKQVIFACRADDDIGALVHTRVNFSVWVMSVPTAENNLIRTSNLGGLNLNDEIVFLIGEIEEYHQFLQYLETYNFIRPTIYLSISSKLEKSKEFMTEFMSDTRYKKNKILLTKNCWDLNFIKSNEKNEE